MMSNSYTIDELISGYYEKKFSQTSEMPLPRYSVRHKRKMNRIFKLFAKNRDSAENFVISMQYDKNNTYKLPLHKRLIFVILIIVFLAVATGFVVIYFSDGFTGVVYHDNTKLFAVNTNDCPASIEKEYYLSVLPEGYELCDLSETSVSRVLTYKNRKTGYTLLFKQSVKSEFDVYINTEGYELEETTIKGLNAVCVEYDPDTAVSSTVIWDNENYILILDGNFAKKDLMNLATVNEKNGF